MTTRKIALIGLGKIAQDQHLPVIDKNPSFELVAVTSQRGLTHKGVPTFTSTSEMYRAVPQIEAVAICTPPDVRHAYAIEALDAGKDVLLEKPTAATLAEAAHIGAHARKSGRVVFATWHSQFNSAVEETRALLAGAGVRRMKIEWREDVRKWHPGQDWVWEAGGFGVFDPGINALSIFVRILPVTPFVKSAALTYPANRQTPIGATLTFSSTDPDAPALSADFDWREQGDEKWHIEIETKGGHQLRLFRGGTCLSVDGHVTVEQPSEEYERIYERFAELLQTRTSDFDITPLQLVGDAMMVGQRLQTDAFEW